MGCSSAEQYAALRKLDTALTRLRRLGLDELDPIYGSIYRARGALLGNVGVRVPRSVLSLIRILGLSPGSVTLFYDLDMGFYTAARETESSPPVYKLAGEDTLKKIIDGSLTHEDFEALKTTDDYLGE